MNIFAGILHPMTQPTFQKKFPGVLMAISSAIFWGISGTCAQYLFEKKGMDPGWLVTWRMVFGGFILVVFSMTQEKRAAFNVWRKPYDIIRIFLFGILGMVAVQYTYFYSISLSNAATATILQYIGPVFVVGFYAIKNRKWPILAEYGALVLALSGTFLLVTHGSFEELVISEKAVFWGILSAIALAFYTIQPVGLLRSFSPSVVVGWGMLIGGIGFSMITQPWGISGNWDMGTWVAFTYIIIFGTVLAFYFFLKSVTLIGATQASLLCSVEPLSAAVTAVVWLGVSFLAMDWIGTLLILLTVVLLTLGKKEKEVPGH
ncbi:MAG: EamA family transporter [Cyclobacteriaceae bacterium]|nr:EamA family transporter [Cyclobacteriaceae bacterium]